MTGKYLVVVRDDQKRPEVAGNIKAALDRTGVADLAFSESSGAFFGIFVRTELKAAQIRARIDGLTLDKDKGFILIVELGDDWSAVGNSAGWRHLQERGQSRPPG